MHFAFVMPNSNKNIEYKDLGSMDYAKAWDYQEKLFNTILDIKKLRREGEETLRLTTPNFLLFCEHQHVYTLGKSGSQSNLLINKELLKSKGASFYKTNRGGDITYHGPGQIVGYPVLDLENFDIGIKDYISLIEETIINTLKEYNIASGRLSGASGVWLDADNNNARKICAIGVKTSRFVSMHGFAFNVNTDLDFYNFINPCGHIDKGVTSLAKEMGKEMDMSEVKERVRHKFTGLFS